jgi:hypothetical protein
VKIEKSGDIRFLVLSDRDEFDYAKAERVFPAAEMVTTEFAVAAEQNDHGVLHVELLDYKGTAALRLVFDSDGYLKMKAGYRMRNIQPYEAGKMYTLRIEATVRNRFYTVFVNDGEGKNGLFFAPVHSLERIAFRTGEVRRFPDTDTPTDQDFDVPRSATPVPGAAFRIYSLTTKNH